MGWRGLGWRYWYWPKGWWCPRHPWPPPWARIYAPPYWYQMDPSEELRILEDIREDLRKQLSDIEKRIEELRKSIEEKR
ncbi:MAG: hypothetical protein L2C94_000490 [Aigarchaeota archaeon]|mgnify:CR=1 FL=1|nr:hypothetical protein [Candidatus Wolframiiraptor gerlachensis]